jgi:hypothetical protein
MTLAMGWPNDPGDPVMPMCGVAPMTLAIRWPHDGYGKPSARAAMSLAITRLDECRQDERLRTEDIC